MQVTRKGNTLTITVEMHAPRPSKTGVMDLVAGSGGWLQVSGPGLDGLRINLNVGIKRPT